MPKKSRKKKSSAAKILAIIGAVISIVFAVLSLIGQTVSIISSPFNIGVGGIVGNIIAILIALIILASYGTVNLKLRIQMSWLVLIILGVLLVFFGQLLGGILVIIAGIVEIIT